MSDAMRHGDIFLTKKSYVLKTKIKTAITWYPDDCEIVQIYSDSSGLPCRTYGT